MLEAILTAGFLGWSSLDVIVYCEKNMPRLQRTDKYPYVDIVTYDGTPRVRGPITLVLWLFDKYDKYISKLES